MQVSQLLGVKYNALEKFTQQLLSSDVRDQIARMILFGSVARGDARQDSDVDVLIFGFGDLRKISEACAEASLDVGMELGEYIQPLVYCIDDFSPPRSYFLYRAIRNSDSSEVIYSMDEDELKGREVRSYLALAQEYCEAAKSELSEERYRVAVDVAYNAAESCVRGLLRLKLLELPRSHGGLINKFSELYIEEEQLPKKLGRLLNIMLEIRSRARYDANAVIEKSMAENAIELAEALMKALKDRMQLDL